MVNMRVGHLIVAVSLTFATFAQAYRRLRPMGDYVREADLIVLADTRRGGERGLDTIVSVTEVIKGEPEMAGTEISLGRRSGTASASVPVPARGVAILMREDWREQKKWPVLEAYAKPEEAAAVRTLVEIYRCPGERQRLVALREKALVGSAHCMAQLLADLRNMREPGNFDLMISLYGDLAPTDQAELVAIMAGTGDTRAIPPLLEAMRSSDEKVSTIAARRLAYVFPGAPGVTAAFEKALATKHLAREVARYLSKRRDDPVLDDINAWRETPRFRAGRLWDAGDRKAARALYMTVVEDDGETDYRRRSAASRILPEADADERERTRKALLALLLTDARAGNSESANETACILRELHHADCLEGLLALMSRAGPPMGFPFERAARTATLAIRELGLEARRQAVTRLIEDCGLRATKGQATPMRIFHVLQLVWLVDKENSGELADIMPDPWLPVWTALSPLCSMTDGRDEGAFLIDLLAKPVKLPWRAPEWVVFRLGDLKEERAVKVLMAALTGEPGWTPTRTASDALVRIGGPEVEKEMLTLTTHDERGRVRRAAIEVLFRLQGERSCDLSRRMLREDDSELKRLAISNLGIVGSVDDLALLLPFCDYWGTDRVTHRWAMQAVSNLRERHNYDINGPIVKKSAKK